MRFCRIVTVILLAVVAATPSLADEIEDLAVLAGQQYAKRQYAESETTYLKVIELAEQKHGLHHPEVVRHYECMGDFYKLQNHSEKAISCYCIAHSTAVKVFGRDNPRTTGIGHKLAGIKKPGRREVTVYGSPKDAAYFRMISEKGNPATGDGNAMPGNEEAPSAGSVPADGGDEMEIFRTKCKSVYSGMSDRDLCTLLGMPISATRVKTSRPGKTQNYWYQKSQVKDKLYVYDFNVVVHDRKVESYSWNSYSTTAKGDYTQLSTDL